jgi:2-aminoethylphosphonate dioxygenase
MNGGLEFVLALSEGHCMTSAVDNDVFLTPEQLREYETRGFLILRGVFPADEMRQLLAESERLLTERRDLISPNNLRCRYMAHHQTGEPLFEVFDPVNDISPVCEQFTTDPRIVSAVESIYGELACLFKEKLIFKPPGALGYKLHQDIPLSWKGFPTTFLTVLIPIDPSSEVNGCTEVFSGYHADFLSNDGATYSLPDDAVDVARRIPLVLNPGDVAIFHGLTPHRSASNRSSQMRRVFYVSYNARSDGGDQRDSHYAEFRDRMRQHLTAQATAPLYFR